ncbi:MAG: hypothetical protein AB9921_06060 [Erysipelotrichaceae bacterium]
MLSKIIVIAKTAEEAVKVIEAMKKSHPEITSIEVRISNAKLAEINVEKLSRGLKSVLDQFSMSKDGITTHVERNPKSEFMENLNIFEAATLASLKCMYMQRESFPGVKIEPTNSDWCCAISGIDGTHRVRGWEPDLDDLIAIDWKVIG